MTREDMLADIDALMGGRIAEEITFGENKVTTGASSDMNRATSLATHMVRNFGFSDKVNVWLQGLILQLVVNVSQLCIEIAYESMYSGIKAALNDILYF